MEVLDPDRRPVNRLFSSTRLDLFAGVRLDGTR
jgi:hypothetical protein